MSRQDFLNHMEEFLQGEVPDGVIRSNLQYYSSYILDQMRTGRSEEEVLAELGDPRLLARTIIDAEDAAEGRPDDGRNAHYGFEDPEGAGETRRQNSYREGYGNSSGDSGSYRSSYGNSSENTGSYQSAYGDSSESDPEAELRKQLKMARLKIDLVIVAVVLVLVLILGLVFRVGLLIFSSPVFWILLVIWFVWRTFFRQDM